MILLLLLSGFFSATETAFTSVSKIKIKNMASDDVTNAELVLEITENFDKFLTTILIGNNIANIANTTPQPDFFLCLTGVEYSSLERIGADIFARRSSFVITGFCTTF